MKANGVSWSEHYIDDFLTMGKPNTEECTQNLAAIEYWCDRLGLPLKREKVEGPATTLEFLGIVLDTLRMEIWQNKRYGRTNEYWLGATTWQWYK